MPNPERKPYHEEPRIKMAGESREEFERDRLGQTGEDLSEKWKQEHPAPIALPVRVETRAFGSPMQFVISADDKVSFYLSPVDKCTKEQAEYIAKTLNEAASQREEMERLRGENERLREENRSLTGW